MIMQSYSVIRNQFDDMNSIMQFIEIEQTIIRSNETSQQKKKKTYALQQAHLVALRS